MKSWPVLGWLARLGGTLLAHRERRTQVGPLNRELQAALDQGALVIPFPEGTSSDGQTVLRFKSALLELAAHGGHPLSACRIDYRLGDGEEVCYWKEMSFVPHLLNLMGKRGIEVSVGFSRFFESNLNRKELASRLLEEVLKLKSRAGYAPRRRRGDTTIEPLRLRVDGSFVLGDSD